MSFTELAGLATFRPFDGPAPPLGTRDSPFSAPWRATVELLADELRHLDARNVVIEVGVTERDLRLDGMPRADARIPPPVRVSFDSKWGPLRYETGEYQDTYWKRVPGWQANLRAIALAMEALRKVDRYGVSKRGEQYQGWKQLPMRAGGFASREQAREYLDRAWAGDLRRALKETHPDRGGDADEFQKVMSAKELIGA